VIDLDSDASNGINGLDEDHVNYLLETLYCAEQNMAAIAINRRQFDLAEEHCQRCLAYLRRHRLKVEEKLL
jgi:ABC-type phosphate/phosphonate transport system ATPase subunit